MQFLQGSDRKDLRCPHSTLGAAQSKLQVPPPPPPTTEYMPPLPFKGNLSEIILKKIIS